MHSTLFLPKLTWHCLPKSHVSAGNWILRLLLADGRATHTSGTHLVQWVPICGQRICLLPTLLLPSTAEPPLTAHSPEHCSPPETAQVVVDIMPAHEVGHGKSGFTPYPSLAAVLLSCSGGVAEGGKLAATAGRNGHQQAAALSGTC